MDPKSGGHITILPDPDIPLRIPPPGRHLPMVFSNNSPLTSPGVVRHAKTTCRILSRIFWDRSSPFGRIFPLFTKDSIFFKGIALE